MCMYVCIILIYHCGIIYDFTGHSSAIIFPTDPAQPQGQQGIIVDYAMPKILGLGDSHGQRSWWMTTVITYSGQTNSSLAVCQWLRAKTSTGHTCRIVGYFCHEPWRNSFMSRVASVHVKFHLQSLLEPGSKHVKAEISLNEMIDWTI